MVLPTASAAPRDCDGGSTGVGGVGGGGDDASEYYVDDVEMMKYYSSNDLSPPLELYDDDINDYDDGGDHANNDYPPSYYGDIQSRHPQHYHYQHHQHNDNFMNQSNHHHQNHHATPHGNMTSILSAAGSHSPQKKSHYQLQQRNNSQQHAQTSTSSGENATIAAKRALRVRASKYFHRGGGGGGDVAITTSTATTASTTNTSATRSNTTPADSGNKSKMNKKAAATEEVEYVDEKGNIRIMNHHSNSSSFSSSSNATTALLSASTSSPIPSGAGATTAPTSATSTTTTATTTAGATKTKSATTNAASARAAKQTTIHDNPSISSALSFFPRTTSSSSSSLLQTRSNHVHQQHHLSQKQQQHSQQQHFQHLQQSVQHPFPSHEEVEGENAADPSLQTYLSPSSSFDNNLCEVQSNATSGYTSGGGSDLEVAARRILRGKKGGSGRVRHHRSLSGTMSESEDDDGFNTDDDDNIGIVNIGHNGGNMSRNKNNGVGRALPPGWRERIQRKTGVQLRKLPSLPSSSPPQTLPPQVGNSLATSSNNASMTMTNTREIVHEGSKIEKNVKHNDIPNSSPVLPSHMNHSYCYETDDNDDPCNQLGAYRSDGQLAMMSASAAYHDDDGENDRIMNEEWQHPPLPQQYYQHQHQHEEEEYTHPARRHPPTPSPTESIETTYHLEDLERNGAFPSTSHNRNHHYHEQNGGYDGGYPAHPHPSGYWQAERHYQEQHQQQRLPILHEHHDHISNQHHNTDFSYDENNYSYDAEEEDEVENHFDQKYYPHDNEEWNPDNLTDTRTYREHEHIQILGPHMEHDKINDNGRQNGGDNIENKIRNSNVSSNTPSAPVIINEYGFPPIPTNPEGTRFGANCYVKEEENRISNNNDSNSRRSRNAVPSSSHETAERRVHFSPSVMEGGVGAIAAEGERRGEGGGGMGRQDVNLDSDGFDDDEYFHRFYSNTYSIEKGPMHEQGKQYRQQQPRRRRHDNDESIRGGIQTSGHWEEIPTSSKVQWASTSSKNEFIGTKTEDTDSAWSLPESTSSSLKIPDASSGRTAAEINIVPSWNVDDAVQGVSSTHRRKLQKEISKEEFMVELNSVMNDITQAMSRPPQGKSLKKSQSHQQRVHAFYDQWVQESKDAQLPARKIADYSLSDGDLSDKGYDTGQSAGRGGESMRATRQKKKGLKFFRGRNRAYNSEGERSDTSVEGGRIKGSLSFNLSPLGARKENKQDKKKDGFGNKTKSPRMRRLFGHMNHQSIEDSFEADGNQLWNVPKIEGGTAGSVPISALFNDAGISLSSVATICSEAMEHDTKDTTTESEVDATPDLDNSLHGLRKPESTTVVSDCNDQQEDQPPMELNLNDSRETHTTPIASNAKTQTRLPANNYIPSGISSHPKQLLSPSGLKGGKKVTIDRIASQRKPGWTQTVASPVQTEFDDDGTVSTLGSLVTRDTESRSVPIPKSKAHFISDASTVTELSEIERLRRENDLLREKLENASQLSSKVTSMYAKSLKFENNRLREEFENVSQLSAIAEHQKDRHHNHKKSLDSVHRTTLETLLEKSNGKKTRKNRRSGSLDSPVADFNHLPPVAHLINGVDFDDDSITSSYYLRGSHTHLKHAIRDDGCATPEDLLKKTCTRIATTTRSVASQMKSALSQDPNNELGVAPSSRPLNCFTTCRRDKTNDGTTIYVTQKQFNSARGNITKHHHYAASSSNRASAASSNIDHVVQ